MTRALNEQLQTICTNLQEIHASKDAKDVLCTSLSEDIVLLQTQCHNERETREIGLQRTVESLDLVEKQVREKRQSVTDILLKVIHTLRLAYLHFKRSL